MGDHDLFAERAAVVLGEDCAARILAGLALLESLGDQGDEGASDRDPQSPVPVIGTGGIELPLPE